MSTQLKDKLVVRDHEGQFHVWTKAEYEAYVTDAIWMGATPSISIVTHFAGTEDLLKDVAAPEASAPLPMGVEEVYKMADDYLSKEKEGVNHITTQMSKDEITSFNTGYFHGFETAYALAGSRYQSQASQQLQLVWKEGKTLMFDWTVLFSKSYNFEGFDLMAQETITPIGRVIIWPDKLSGNKKWAFYFEYDGWLKMDFNSEKEVKDFVQQSVNKELLSQHAATEQKQAQVSLKDHAVGFAKWLQPARLKELKETESKYNYFQVVNRTYAEWYDLWPEREQSKKNKL